MKYTPTSKGTKSTQREILKYLTIWGIVKHLINMLQNNNGTQTGRTSNIYQLNNKIINHMLCHELPNIYNNEWGFRVYTILQV